MITHAKVQLHCRELKRFKIVNDFWDSGGITTGSEYGLTEDGEPGVPGGSERKYDWAVRTIISVNNVRETRP